MEPSGSDKVENNDFVLSCLQALYLADSLISYGGFSLRMLLITGACLVVSIQIYIHDTDDMIV